MNKNKVPVTIITGFLGSGKTTLLNRLIADNPEKKFAIIENEFGDIPIDQELVINARDGIFEMSSGCICCSLNEELGQLLLKLSSPEYTFDHLLIETTGIAEPDAVAAAFLGSGKESKYVLDGTICLADARDIAQNLQERGEAVRQVSFADVILLNKTDLVNEEHLTETKLALSQLNADAKIVGSSFGRCETNLLNLKAYDSLVLESRLLMPRPHHHHHDLTAHSFEFPEPLNPEKFEHWINTLLFLSGYQIYRIKGILNIHQETHKVILQSVRSNSKIEIGNPWMKDEIRLTKLVFIGYNIKRDPLEKGLNSCKLRQDVF
jgi:G3E family GTPase